jgi:hypothetical protein
MRRDFDGMVDLDSFVGVNALKFDEGWPADPGGRLTWELRYRSLCHDDMKSCMLVAISFIHGTKK